jgi:hypothetical protein
MFMGLSRFKKMCCPTRVHLDFSVSSTFRCKVYTLHRQPSCRRIPTENECNTALLTRTMEKQYQLLRRVYPSLRTILEPR